MEAEANRLGIAYAPREIEEMWENACIGIYGVCLRSATPANVVRKDWLLGQIEA